MAGRNLDTDPFYRYPYEVLQRECLNYFDAGANSNKFYIAEVHKSNASMGFRLYVTYGRVGADGQVYLYDFGNEWSAKDAFDTKVRSKEAKGYVRVDIAQTNKGSEVAKKQLDTTKIGNVKPKVGKCTTNSKLDPQIVEFVSKIYAEANQAISLSVTGSVNGNAAGPIGNMGVKGIQKGRNILSDVTYALQQKNMAIVFDLSQQYYRYVPRVMPKNLRIDDSWVLKTQDRIQKEYDTLQLYEDALRMSSVMGVSDIDAKYQGLKTDIRVVDAKTLEYIKDKVAKSHAPNHHYKLKVTNAFEVNQHNAPKFDNSCGNVRNLFHGTRSANMTGILSSHLRLPKNLGSNVQITGAMFGPGIYFASDCTKSANYSFGTWAGRPNKYDTAYLFIVEVALGEVHKVDRANYFLSPPKGYDSVMGCKGTQLINNEFIVYKENQARLRYIVEVEKH